MSGEPVEIELVLHRDQSATIVVSRVVDTRTFALSKREVSYRHLAGRVANGPKGAKLAIVAVTMPVWLARREGLT